MKAALLSALTFALLLLRPDRGAVADYEVAGGGAPSCVSQQLTAARACCAAEAADAR